MVEGVGSGFKVKKWGIIPPKRRSVKRMMLHKFLNSVFQACRNPVSSLTVSCGCGCGCGKARISPALQ
ncbi:hypothetical protein V6N13_012206 [Hibiscus sabdariffa]